jgi:hypothetical protein
LAVIRHASSAANFALINHEPRRLRTQDGHGDILAGRWSAVQVRYERSSLAASATLAPAKTPQVFPFDNSYARLPERFFARVPPTPVAAPGLVHLSEKLARQPFQRR